MGCTPQADGSSVLVLTPGQLLRLENKPQQQLAGVWWQSMCGIGSEAWYGLHID